MILPSYRCRAHYAAESAYPGLWHGLRGAWAMTLGVSGMTVKDISRHGNDGTLDATMTNADWIRADPAIIPGYALDFDDIDDEILMTGSASKMPNPFSDTSGVSMVAWFNITNDHASGGTLCGRGGSLNNGSWFLQAITTGRIKFSVDMSSGDLSATSPTSTYSQNTWNQAAIWWPGTVDGADCKMWLNGREVTGLSTGAGGSLKNSTQDFNICKGGAGDVQIAQVLLYDRELTDNEMMTLYLFPQAPFALQAPTIGFVSGGAPPAARVLYSNPISAII